MAWMRSLILFVGLAACSPAPQKDARNDIGNDAPPAIRTASVSAPNGHTPFPVNGYHPGIYLFHGYRCGTDCLLHQKGYQWGSEHKVADPKDCRGTSEEFIEGCLAFAGIEGPLGERDFDVSFPHVSGIN
ncbi:MAG TPA: hypothetical protein VN685_12055 [Rhizomicrobium sp.]|nr:hypothetical protein [Rhizomicrobium sp.]